MSKAPSVAELMALPPGLELAYRDWRALASMRHPARVAIWLALLRQDGELVRREAEFMADPAAGERPAILAFAEALVLRAIRGDNYAAALVKDRIEGKAGLRQGDEAESNAARRIGVISALAEAIEAMTDHKIESSKLIIQDAEVTGITPVDRNDSIDQDGRPLRFYDGATDSEADHDNTNGHAQEDQVPEGYSERMPLRGRG